MKKIYINSGKIRMLNATLLDIENSMKALKLLKQEVTNIETTSYFDFDTEYYRRFKEEEIDKLYRICNGGAINVEYRNKKLYYKSLILPQCDYLEWVEINYKDIKIDEDETKDEKEEVGEVAEWCGECDSENCFIWNVERDGYETVCLHCGEKLMLCDECFHSEDNPLQKCSEPCWRVKETEKP